MQEAAVEYFAARSHNSWRRQLLKNDPAQKRQPRMRLRGGVMVDINQRWEKLHPKAQLDNKRAGADAYKAVMKFPNDREAAAAYVHECWIRRNKADPNQPKALFKPYQALPEAEKDKDRAHVDNMKRAIAAVSRSARRTAAGKAAPRKASRKAPRQPVRGASAFKSVRVPVREWRRLETLAARLSKTLGRPVTPQELLRAGITAIAEVCSAIEFKARSK